MTVTDNSQTLVNALAEIKRLEGEIQRQRERHRATWTQLEQVKGLLRCARTQLDDSGVSNVLRGQIDAALSQQAEPVECPVCCSDEPHTGTCGSSDPRALCNRAEAEPAPAQDDITAFQFWRMARGWDDPITPLEVWNAALRHAATRPAQTEQQPELTVWEGPMPESNGKSNFTAVLMRKGADLLEGISGGMTIARSEYPDRVRYEADCVRWLIGEMKEEPCITDYDADKHSGYATPIEQTAPDSDMRDNYLDLLQEVLDAKEVMRAAGIEQGSFGAMFKQLAKQTAQQPEQRGLVLMPKEATPEIVAAMKNALDKSPAWYCRYKAAYRAALSAQGASK